jgi:selenium metabolism protein YedF
MTHTIDATGLICPQPLILTRKTLKQSMPGDILQIICDNRTAYQNVLTFLKDQSLEPKGREEEGVFSIEVINLAKDADTGVEKCCTVSVPISSDYVVVISSDKMGEGDPQLGMILMKGFLNSLHEQEIMPTHLVFYNSGAKMVIPEAGVLSSLKELEEKGVEILVCGTCVDFYGIKEQMAVGKISNMFTITGTMANTGHVVKP